MFLVMLEVDGYIRYRVPSLTSAVVADDYQILVIEGPATIIVSFTLAAGVTLDALRAYDLPSALKKQATLASSLEVSKKIVKAMPLLKNTVTRTTRNLGVDFTLRGARLTPTFTARFRKATWTAAKMKKPKNAGVRTSRYVQSLVNATTCWGAAVTGASSFRLSMRRRLAHSLVVKQSKGRSRTADLLLDKIQPRTIDPVFRLRGDALQMLSTAVWEEWVPVQWIAVVWNQCFDGARDGNVNWRNATDPISVAALSGRWMGWGSASPLVLTDSLARPIDLRETCPHTIKRLVASDIDRTLREQMGEGLPKFQNNDAP